MPNLSSLDLSPEKILSFLKQDLRFKEIYQEILCRQIIQEASRTRAIVAKPEEIQAEIAKLRDEHHLESLSDWTIWLEEEMITLSELKDNIQIRLLAQKLAHDLFAVEIEQMFQHCSAEFQQVLLYRVAVPYERLAQELFYRIEESEISFYEAAHLYDVHERRRLHCGYEGKHYRRDLKPDVATLIFDGNGGEGRIVGPLQYSSSTYDLLLVEQFIPAELSAALWSDLLSEKFKAWLDREIELYLG